MLLTFIGLKKYRIFFPSFTSRPHVKNRVNKQSLLLSFTTIRIFRQVLISGLKSWADVNYFCVKLLRIKSICLLTIPGAPKAAEQQTKETIPGLMQTPLTQPSVPGQTLQIPGLNAPAADTTQTAQFSQTQLQGQTTLLGQQQQQQPSPLVPPPLPPSPFGSQMGQKPMMPMPGISVSDNGAGLLQIDRNETKTSCAI